MKFTCPLIAVADVERSKAFYINVMEQSVILDFDWNVTFSGGFAIQYNFDVITGVSKESIKEREHNFELYFETEDFDATLKRLEAFDIEYLHPPKTYDWRQRVVRIYDPDKHIIEIGEAMHVVIKKLLDGGCSVEEAVKISQHPLEFVQAVAEGKMPQA